jgi:hypothetical protein
MSNDKLTPRRRKLIFTILYGVTMGIMGDVLAAAILFHGYSSFFESVVVALLVMVLCSVALLRSELSPGGLLQLPSVAEEGDPVAPLLGVQSQLKGVFYGIAFLMAVAKLVLIVIGSLLSL